MQAAARVVFFALLVAAVGGSAPLAHEPSAPESSVSRAKPLDVKSGDLVAFDYTKGKLLRLRQQGKRFAVKKVTLPLAARFGVRIDAHSSGLIVLSNDSTVVVYNPETGETVEYTGDGGLGIGSLTSAVFDETGMLYVIEPFDTFRGATSKIWRLDLDTGTFEEISGFGKKQALYLGFDAVGNLWVEGPGLDDSLGFGRTFYAADADALRQGGRGAVKFKQVVAIGNDEAANDLSSWGPGLEPWPAGDAVALHGGGRKLQWIMAGDKFGNGTFNRGCDDEFGGSNTFIGALAADPEGGFWAYDLKGRVYLASGEPWVNPVSDSSDCDLQVKRIGRSNKLKKADGLAVIRIDG